VTLPARGPPRGHFTDRASSAPVACLPARGPMSPTRNPEEPQILQILSVTLFEKVPVLQAFQAADSQSDSLDDGTQLILFDF